MVTGSPVPSRRNIEACSHLLRRVDIGACHHLFIDPPELIGGWLRIRSSL
jgi:hypothetical protein